MKKLISLLLVIVLIASILPSAAFAWEPDEIMDSLPSTVEKPKSKSWLEESRTMYVASEYGKLIYIMRAPKEDSKKLGEANEAESVTVYAIQSGYALAIVDSTGEGGWMNMDHLVDEYYREGPGPEDTLDVKKGVIRPANDEYFDDYQYFTVKSKNGSSTVIYKGPKTTSDKLSTVKDGETVTGLASSGNSTFVRTEDDTLGWVQTKYLEPVDGEPADDDAPEDADENTEPEGDTDSPDDEDVPTDVAGQAAVAEWSKVEKLYTSNLGLIGLRKDGSVLIEPNAVAHIDFSSGRVYNYTELYGEKRGYIDCYDPDIDQETVDAAIKEISGWRKVANIFEICGIPLAVTTDGKVLIPEIFYCLSSEIEGIEDTLDAIKKVNNAEKIYCEDFDGFSCIYVVEKGGKIHSFPCDYNKETYFEEIVNPADVFDSNSYSNVIMRWDTALGINKSDGTLENTALLPEALSESVSDWKNIEQIYIFDSFVFGSVEIIFGVDSKGKTFAEFYDEAAFDSYFGESVIEEASTWEQVVQIDSYGNWDDDIAQIACLMENGEARIYNGSLYSSSPEFSTVSDVSDVWLGYCDLCYLALMLHNDGSIEINLDWWGDDSSFSGSCSCSKKLVSFGEYDNDISFSQEIPYYGIAKDGTVGYIEYTFTEE